MRVDLNNDVCDPAVLVGGDQRKLPHLLLGFNRSSHLIERSTNFGDCILDASPEVIQVDIAPL